MNPILEALIPRMPLDECSIATLPTSGSTLVLYLRRRGKSAVRREDLESAAGDDVARVTTSRNRILNLDVEWENLEHLEEWIESAAWELGALFMTRQYWPRLADPKTWRDAKNGLMAAFCGLDSVIKMGAGPVGDARADNSELAQIAAREGHWKWIFAPNRGLAEGSHALNAVRSHDSTLLIDGSRKGPFPGWISPESHKGKSGDWWRGIAKSFETSEEPGHGIELIYNFATRKLDLAK